MIPFMQGNIEEEVFRARMSRVPMGILQNALLIVSRKAFRLGEIPITFTFQIHQISLHNINVDLETIAELPGLTVIDFGRVDLETGEVLRFLVYNPNWFSEHFELEIAGSTQFRLKGSAIVLLESRSYCEVEIEFLQASSDMTVKNKAYNGSLFIKSQCKEIAELCIPISGTLSDVFHQNLTQLGFDRINNNAINSFWIWFHRLQKY